MAKKMQTNVEFVKAMMNVSRRGALAQMFILTAIEKYAEQVVEAGAEKMDTPWLNGTAWVDVAKEVLEKMEERSKEL